MLRDLHLGLGLLGFLLLAVLLSGIEKRQQVVVRLVAVLRTFAVVTLMVVMLVVLLVPSVSLLQAIATLRHFAELRCIAVEVRIVVVYFLVLTHAHDRDGRFESELRFSLQILVQLRRTADVARG